MVAIPTGASQTFTFRDTRGFVSTVRFYLKPDTAANQQTAALTVSEAILACSSTAAVKTEDGTITLVKSKGPLTTVVQPWLAASASAYDTVADKVALLINDADGIPHTYLIACPLPVTAGGNSFLADNKTIDKTNVQWLALATALTGGAWCSPQGVLLASWVQGYRVSKKLPKRFNRGILDATGTTHVWPQ